MAIFTARELMERMRAGKPTIERIVETREMFKERVSPKPVGVAFTSVDIPRPAQRDILKLVVGTVFPPAAAILQFPEAGEEVLKVLPQAVMETAFPITSVITKQLPYETMLKGESARQIKIIPEVLMTPIEKGELTKEYEKAWEGAKTVPQIPDILPDMPDVFPGEIFGDLKKYLLIGALVLGGLFVAGKVLGRKT